MIPDLHDNFDAFEEKPIDSTLVYDGKLLKVNQDRVQLPDGRVGRREWINHPGACAVVPLTDNGETILLRQFRYGPRRMFWEVPAGKIDPGEAIETTAIRELQEETGMKAGKITKIGHYYGGIGYTNEIIHVYLAEELKPVKAETDSDEFLQPVYLPFAMALDMLDNGEIDESKTIIALTMARRYLSNQ